MRPFSPWDFTGKWSLGVERVVPCQNCPGGFELAAGRLWGGKSVWLHLIVPPDPFGSCDPLKWYLDAIWSSGWSDSSSRASALSDQGRWWTAEEKRAMKGRWGKSREKGRAHARGKTTIFQGRTSFSKHRYDSSLFWTARANTAHKNKLACLAFIQDLKRQKEKKNTICLVFSSGNFFLNCVMRTHCPNFHMQIQLVFS